MNTENRKAQDINEEALRALFRADHTGDDMADPSMPASDTDFLSAVKAGIEKKARKRRLLAMLPALAFTCLLAFLVLPNLPLILDALQVSLPESLALMLADLSASLEFKVGLVLIFGLGVPWLIDTLEQTT